MTPHAPKTIAGTATLVAPTADKQRNADLLHDVHRRFLRTLVFASFVTLVSNLAVLLVPLYSMELYDAVQNTRNLRTLMWLTVALGLVLALYGALEYARSLLYEAMGQRAARDLGLPTLMAAAQGVENESHTPPGQVIRDLNELRAFVSSGAMTTPLDMIWTPLLIVVLFIFHWSYGLYALACTAILLSMSVIGDALTRRPLEEANDQRIRAFAEVAVAMRNAETVEGLGMVPSLSRRWRISQNAMLDRLWRGTRATKTLAALIKTCRFMMSGGVVCIGLLLTVDGSVTGGMLLAGSIILNRLLGPFEQMTTSWRAWVSAGAAWQRLKNLLLHTKPLRGTLSLPCPEGRVEVDRLVYIAPGSDRPILRGVSFTIEPGEVLGIIGPSGAGKSTLARLVVGIEEPTAGGVWLDGNNTWLWERSDFGRHVGYMPQTTALLDATVGENIARLRDAHPQAIIEAAARAGIHDAIMRLPNGYATRIGDAGFVLSGGQRQRLALARALFGSPKLLVLDEPNANLDDEGERILLNAVRRAQAESASVLMIAHRPSLMTVADKLLVLKDGIVERFGTREKVMDAVRAPAIQLVRGGTAPQARLAAR
jgi:ATP-binding cassette subfamily C protein